MCIGKWHLGHLPQYLPTSARLRRLLRHPLQQRHERRGCCCTTPETVEEPATLETLTPRYTEQAVKFIERSKDSPFFLYMPHTVPAHPAGGLAAVPRQVAAGALRRRGRGDRLERGRGARRAEDAPALDHNTLVMFSSDNGPWYQGSPGTLRGRKGMTWEGGVREPFIARMPGRIPKGKVCDGIAGTMDILPTVAKLCGAPLPAKPARRHRHLAAAHRRKARTRARGVLLYFDNIHLQCARLGRWKLHVARYNSVTYSPDAAAPGASTCRCARRSSTTW